MAVTQKSKWDNVGTEIPAGQAKYEVGKQPIAEYDNWINYNLAKDIENIIADVINKFNANTILKADTDNTPIALTIDEQRILGRITGGTIAGLTAAQIRTLINVEDGATKYPDTGEQAFLDADHTKLDGIATGANNYSHPSAPPCQAATAAQTGHATAAQISKLNSIESGATADQTKADIDALAINAGQVDGIEGSAIFKKDGSVAMTGDLDMSSQAFYSSAYLYAKADFYPDSTANNRYLGGSGAKWGHIYGVVVHEGDVAFTEKECVICGKKFKLGDNLILKVIQFDEETEEPMAIPIHAECASKHKTFTKKYAIKEDYDVWDEDKGEIVTRKRNKTIKKKIVKKKIKQGYELDTTTKKFWKMEEQADKMARDKMVSKVEATEDVEEEISEIVYEEKEFVI